MIHWFIDDDPENREQFERLYPGCSAFEGPYEAMTEGQGNPDVIAIDLSSCGTLTETHSAYAPICSLIERYPGALLLVMSGLTIGYSRDVVADVLRIMPDADIRAIGLHDDIGKLYSQLAARPREKE